MSKKALAATLRPGFFGVLNIHKVPGRPARITPADEGRRTSGAGRGDLCGRRTGEGREGKEGAGEAIF